MKVIHIGLPKTATTTLQRHIFPRLQAFNLVGDYNPRELLVTLKRINRGFFSDDDVLMASRQIEALDRPLISLEGLVGTDPESWLEQCERNLRIFGSDSTIIITLREPKGYLRSVYQQVVHQGNVVRPEYFFLAEYEYARCKFLPRQGNLSAINVDAFDYESLIAMYQARFFKVVVVAMESLGGMDFMEVVYAINANQKKELQKQFVIAPRQNEAYSKMAMSLTFLRDRLFRSLGAKTMGSEDWWQEFCLDQSREKASIKPWVSRVGKRLQRLIGWRKFMQHIVSKWGPRSRWELPKSIYLGQHLERNTVYYQALLRDGGVRVLAFNPSNHQTPSIEKQLP